MELTGARNVFIRIGNGRLHLYDQPPKNPGRGSIHHFGIQTDNLARLSRKFENYSGLATLKAPVLSSTVITLRCHFRLVIFAAVNNDAEGK